MNDKHPRSGSQPGEESALSASPGSPALAASYSPPNAENVASGGGSPDRWCLRCRAALPANSRGLPYCDACRNWLAPASGRGTPEPVCPICQKAGCFWIENSIFPHPAVGSSALSRERRFLTVEQLRKIIARELGLEQPPSTFWRVQPDGEFVGVVVW